MMIAAFDTGLGGAICTVAIDPLREWDVIDMPTLGEGKQRVLNGREIAAYLTNRKVGEAVVEFASARPKEGVGSAFRFGGSYHGLLVILQILVIPFRIVTPRKWKGDMALNSDKELSRRQASMMIPSLAPVLGRKMDHNRAEAAMLALWASRQPRLS